jgi:hypothetical protein
MRRSVFATALAFVLGSVATALASSSAWRVFATGTDTSQYGAYASASADAPRSQALGIRATSSPGRSIKVTAFRVLPDRHHRAFGRPASAPNTCLSQVLCQRLGEHQLFRTSEGRAT